MYVYILSRYFQRKNTFTMFYPLNIIVKGIQQKESISLKIW